MTREENLHWIDQEPTTKNDIRDNRVKNELNRVKDELEPTTKNNRGVDCSLDDFIKYCKRTFGIELTVKKSDNSDTYAKLFGTTKNDCAKQNGCISCSLDDGDDCCRKLYEESMQDLTTKNDLGVDWESYKDVDGNSLDDLILDVIQRNFDCGNTYGYKVADEIIGLLPSVTPQEPILDKIRAEIKNLERFEIRGEVTPLVNVDRVLKIIDKVENEVRE